MNRPLHETAANILEDLFAYRPRSATKRAKELTKAVNQDPTRAAFWAKSEGAPMLFDALARVCGMDETLLSSESLDSLDHHCPKPRIDWTLEQWTHWRLFKAIVSLLQNHVTAAEEMLTEGLVVAGTFAHNPASAGPGRTADLSLALNYYLALCKRRLGDYASALHHIQQSRMSVASRGLDAFLSVEHARILLSIGHNYAAVEELLLAAEVLFRDAEDDGSEPVDASTLGLLYALQARLQRRRKGGLPAAAAAIEKALSLPGLPARHKAGFLSDRALITTLTLRESVSLVNASAHAEMEQAVLEDLEEAERLYVTVCKLDHRPAKILNTRALLRIALGNFADARVLSHRALQLPEINVVEQSTAHVLGCMCECLASDGNPELALNRAYLAFDAVKATAHQRKQARAIIWQGRAWLLSPYRAADRAKKCLEVASTRLATEDLGYIRDEWLDLQLALKASQSDDVLFILRRSDLLPIPGDREKKRLWSDFENQFNEAFVRAASALIDEGTINKTSLTKRNIARFDRLRAEIEARDQQAQHPHSENKTLPGGSN